MASRAVSWAADQVPSPTFIWTTLLALSVIILLAPFILLYILTPRPRAATPSERTCTLIIPPSSDASTEAIVKTGHALPGIFSEPEVKLSVVIPAFNEQDRLPAMLKETAAFLNSQGTDPIPPSHLNAAADKANQTYEIILVDDHSDDDTIAVAQEQALELNLHLRIIALEENRGKGGAVKHGVLHCRGERILFVDADGASRFSDLDKLHAAMDEIEQEKRVAMVVGSRAHLVTTQAVVKRSILRNFLMHAFHFILSLLVSTKVKDTQCGFKLFTRRAAQEIFPRAHLEGFIFDVELLLIAQAKAIPIAEVAVGWHEVAGSKLNVGTDSIKMAIELVIARANYSLGFWKP